MLCSSDLTIPSVFRWEVGYPQTSLQFIGWLTWTTYMHIHIYMHVYGLWHGARAPGDSAGGHGEGFEPVSFLLWGDSTIRLHVLPKTYCVKIIRDCVRFILVFWFQCWARTECCRIFTSIAQTKWKIQSINHLKKTERKSFWTISTPRE